MTNCIISPCCYIWRMSYLTQTLCHENRLILLLIMINYYIRSDQTSIRSDYGRHSFSFAAPAVWLPRCRPSTTKRTLLLLILINLNHSTLTTMLLYVCVLLCMCVTAIVCVDSRKVCQHSGYLKQWQKIQQQWRSCLYMLPHHWMLQHLKVYLQYNGHALEVIATHWKNVQWLISETSCRTLRVK